jgi:hypothetical protein
MLRSAIAGFVDRGRTIQRGSVERVAVNRHAVVMSLTGAACLEPHAARTPRPGDAPANAARRAERST